MISRYNTDILGMIPGEVKRIIKYQKANDVATLSEFKEYLEWLWSQTILKENS